MSKTTNKFSPEVRARAVRLVLDNESQHGSRWQAVMSISAKIGCAPQTLNEWVKKTEVDSGKRAGIPTDMAEKMKALERENRELRQANEILRKASAYFAAADTRPPLSANDRISRRSPWCLWCRAGLPGSGDRPVHLLRTLGEAVRSGTAAGSCPARRIPLASTGSGGLRWALLQN